MSLFTGAILLTTLKWLQFSLTICTYSHGQDTPSNAVGLFGDDIILECNRNATHDVRWKYMATGNSVGQPIQRRHRTVTTNYGINRLIIEDVQLSDAGTYVCESPKYPAEFPRSVSYLAVLTHPPVCTNNFTDEFVIEGDMAKLTCWLHYVGVPQARLTMTWTGPEGTTLRAMVFNQTGNPISSASLTVQVPVQPPRFKPHKCQVTFTTASAYRDLASNDPVFTGAECETPTTHVRYLRPPTSSPAIEVTDALPSGSWNCTSTGSGASPVPDVERQQGEDVKVWKAASTFLPFIATAVVIGVLAAVCILLVRVNRTMSQVLDECREVFPEGLTEYRRKSLGIRPRPVNKSLGSSSLSADDPDKCASASKADSAEKCDNLDNEELTSGRDDRTDAPEYRSQCTEVSVEIEPGSPTHDGNLMFSHSHSYCSRLLSAEPTSNRCADQQYDDQDEPREVSLHPELELLMLRRFDDTETLTPEPGHVTVLGGSPEVSCRPQGDVADESLVTVYVNDSRPSRPEVELLQDEQWNVSPRTDMVAENQLENLHN